MSQQRWARIDRLLGAALERPPDERTAFLREACDGDAPLRRELESLLAHDDTGRAEGFLEGAALDLLGRPMASEQEPSFAGRQFGPYQIRNLLGTGGMGDVYRAHDTRLARDVALKILRTDLFADDDRKRLFISEARSASALNHPNIVTIHDIDQADGLDFIVMECVEGQSLEHVMLDGRLTFERALKYAAQIASALQAAHAAGIAHRDIKPANVMVSAAGHTKVLDFGLAKLVDRAVHAGASNVTSSIVTQAGALLGTPAYMSPEQARGLPVDGKSDVFSFGAMLYEMLAGCRPFAGNTPLATLAAIIGKTHPPLRSLRPHLPVDVERLTDLCLQKDPAARPEAAEIVRRLEAMRLRRTRSPVDLRRALFRPAVSVPLLVLVMCILAVAWSSWAANVRAHRARLVVLPEIQRLINESDYDGAFRLARRTMEVLPNDPGRGGDHHRREDWVAHESKRPAEDERRARRGIHADAPRRTHRDLGPHDEREPHDEHEKPCPCR
jgi:serine/threonine protein kinase